MRVLTGPPGDWEPQRSPTAVTVGVFDGLHIGHRVILDRLEAADLPRMVLTFDPHPGEVLRPGTSPLLITTIEERIALFESAGVDIVGVLDLARIRNFEPERFVSEVLVGVATVGCLVVGRDFHFGRDRAGDVPFLMSAGERHGFEVEVVDLVELDGVVTSSRIRRMVQEGEVAAVAGLLGTRYRLSNIVVRGESRGVGLGFPTANLRPPPRKVIPGRGIYAALAEFGGQTHQAAVNVGVRPTFGGGELLIEAYVLDFAGDLYGQRITLEFVARLRPELEFENVEALVARMSDDVADVRRILDSPVAG